MSLRGWVGVDLDGTLAEYDQWVGVEHIGKPIMPMVERVKKWVAQGTLVKIFTARVYRNDALTLKTIEKWSLENIGVVLPVTCVKDYGMIELWDDRAIQVIPNTGKRADGK